MKRYITEVVSMRVLDTRSQEAVGIYHRSMAEEIASKLNQDEARTQKERP